MKDFLKIGKISKFHGIKGAVKVIPVNKDMEEFYEVEEITVDDTLYEILEVKFLNDKVILTLKGIESIEDTLKLKNKDIYIKRPDEKELPKDVFYVGDIENLEVYDENDVFLGEIFEVIETGSNDVYWIKEPKEILIPAIDEIIKEIDLKSKKMIIRPLKEWHYEDWYLNSFPRNVWYI